MAVHSRNKAKVNNAEKPQLNPVDLLAKFDDLQTKVKNIKDSELTQNMTSDPDEPSPPVDNEPPAPPVKEPGELLSTNVTVKAAQTDCPPQPEGWNDCAYGKIFTVPAYCSSDNRILLNGGEPLNYKQCAFLTAQSSACSNYFYTTSTSSSSVGACKCCKGSPNDINYYKSSQCNYVYYASPSCNIR